MVLMLCEERLGVRSYTHVVEPDFAIPSEMEQVLESDIRRLLNAEPIQYVLGFCDFYGRRFSVSPAVLIPRPETELLVREAVVWALAQQRPLRILDMCTGSGCIAWSLHEEIPDAEVVGVDISEEALAIAAGQFGKTGPEFIRVDVLGGIPDFGGLKFDLIVSNPPYIMEKEKAAMRPNVLDWEPGIALFVPDEDPLVFYRAVAGWAEKLLAPGGLGIVEINESLGESTAAVFAGSGFSDVRQVSDYFGKSRFVEFSK